MLSYAARRNFFEKAEWSWRVEDEALVATDHLGREDIGPWGEVMVVRLAFAPTEPKPWRHVLVLTFRNGAKWTIDNAHFKGVADFEDRSASYAPFARAVVSKIAEMSPHAQARVGASPAGYWMSMAFLALVFAGLAALLQAAPLDGIPFVAWAKLGIVLFFLPALGVWMVRSRPRGMRLEDVPDDALPKTAA